MLPATVRRSCDNSLRETLELISVSPPDFRHLFVFLLFKDPRCKSDILDLQSPSPSPLSGYIGSSKMVSVSEPHW